ncbi:MAG: serine/threonine protein kinase [Proteobacteria bacterium]|nr:serine/threonine protein kinase [Pseudomonadota bacterium]
MNAPHPYSALTPDVVVSAVEELGHRCDGRILALNSYENRVYQVGREDNTPVVVKFYRPERWPDAAILEEHEFALELARAEIPVIAPDLHDGRSLFKHEGFRYAVYPRAGGRWPELGTRDDRQWMGRFLARIHAIGRTRPFRHRPHLDWRVLGQETADYLLDSGWIPSHLEVAYESLAEDVLSLVEQRFEEATPLRTLRLHGDCHPGNVLWTEKGPHFVDLDDCMTGPAVQDLWMLLSGRPEEMRAQLDDIVAGYQEFADFDQHETTLIEPLRTLRIMHYAGWLARRWKNRYPDRRSAGTCLCSREQALRNRVCK